MAFKALGTAKISLNRFLESQIFDESIELLENIFGNEGKIE